MRAMVEAVIDGLRATRESLGNRTLSAEERWERAEHYGPTYFVAGEIRKIKDRVKRLPGAVENNNTSTATILVGEKEFAESSLPVHIKNPFKACLKEGDQLELSVNSPYGNVGEGISLAIIRHDKGKNLLVSGWVVLKVGAHVLMVGHKRPRQLKASIVGDMIKDKSILYTEGISNLIALKDKPFATARALVGFAHEVISARAQPPPAPAAA